MKMVDRISSTPPVGSGSPNSDQPVHDPEMAGYIDDLLALSGTQDWSLFKGILQSGDASSPQAQMALRSLLTVMGQPGFAAALQREYAYEQANPSKQSQAFQNLYTELTAEQSIPPSLQGSTPGMFNTQSISLLDLAQKFTKDGGEDWWTGTQYDQTFMADLLGTGSSLDQMINGFAGGEFNGLLNNYNQVKPAAELKQMELDLQLFYKDVNSGNIDKALRAINSIANLAQQYPDLANDPNYQLAIALLNEPSFNSGSGTLNDANGQPVKDAAGDVIYASSLLQIAKDYANGGFLSKDLPAICNDVKKILASGTIGPDGPSWLDFYGSTLANLFN